SVERANGQGFVSVESAVSCIFPFSDGDQIFVADSVFIFHIKSWFIGTYHSGKQFLKIHIFPDVLRPLMNIHKAPYTVSCTVSIVFSCVSLWLSCDCIQLNSAGSFWKSHHRQADHPLKHPCSFFPELF